MSTDATSSPADVRALVLAVVSLAGPLGPQWRTRVMSAVTELGTVLVDRSAVYRRDELFLTAVVFGAELVELEFEQSSTRMIVHLRSEPSRWAKDGRETARTYRTDTPQGRVQRDQLTGLVGRRVRVWVGHEGDDNFRVLLHAVAVGPSAGVPRG